MNYAGYTGYSDVSSHAGIDCDQEALEVTTNLSTTEQAHICTFSIQSLASLLNSLNLLISLLS